MIARAEAGAWGDSTNSEASRFSSARTSNLASLELHVPHRFALSDGPRLQVRKASTELLIRPRLHVARIKLVFLR
jgi:hypothetical protein